MDEQAWRLDELREEARYRRERLELYRARMYGGRARSGCRLREYERASEGASARLCRAEAQLSSSAAERPADSQILKATNVQTFPAGPEVTRSVRHQAPFDRTPVSSPRAETSTDSIESPGGPRSLALSANDWPRSRSRSPQ